MTDGYKDEIRKRAGLDGLDLYRVGVPSIGETYGGRFTGSRDTGGLGTGVYAFTTREAAEDNADAGQEVFVLENALSNPIRPEDFQTTVSLNDLGIEMARAATRVRRGESSFPEERDRPDRRLKRKARDVLFGTPELQDLYGFDTDEFVEDVISATALAEQSVETEPEGTVAQPINHLLWPEFDGVYPEGEAGESGTYGAVIYKTKIDECVGRRTERAEQIPADTLNDCFRRND
ncbi:hypothetical protein [uncultured Halorubrum sp.]|uniref:hypothetical protein n=1 Tax=uncultured Halorubrum sp. TaxID=399555 RepID=UPI002625C7A9|nr:hypothetical protein [uncultured Halorubrum sp.]